MAYTTIDDPTLYFNTKLYSGDGASTQAITGVNFRPDFVWIKSRNHTENHMLSDAVRGSTKRLRSDTTNAEDDLGSNGIQSFNTDGFTAGDGDAMNASGQTYASWNWLANGSGSSNTDGSITSTVSANTTAGFSIVTWTAGSGVGSIGHGLGVAPSMIIVKGRSSAIGWVTGLKSNGWNNYLQLQSTNANTNDQRMFSPSGQSDPTSTVWYQDHAALGSSGDTMVGYVFAEKKGFSKFGSYVGNGSTSGTYVHLGFKPAFVMYKNTSQADDWFISDSKRLGYNPDNHYLRPSLSAAEGDPPDRINFFSNGFKLTTSDKGANASGDVYIYMAFAESPFVTGASAIPTTAR